MTAYIHIVIGVLSVKQCSFSSILNCTKLTTSCPTADQWLERGKLFNCPGNRKYVCLMAPGNELREGCIFNYTIQAGQTGCPYTKQCDIRTGQPLLVVYQNYLPCPPDHNGCPPRNHSGYSILEIYKYARCQGRNTSDKSSVSPDKVTGAPTTTTPDTILHYENWKLNTLSIAVGLLFLLVVFYLVFRGKCKGRSEYKSLGIIQAENNLYRENKSTINQEQLAEMGAIPHEQQHLLLIKENSSPDTTVETELPNFTYSTKKTVSKKKDQQHLRHTHYSSSEDSYSSQTPLLPDETQQTYFSLSSHKPQPDSSFIVSEKDTQLYQAASDGDIETLKKLIDARADVNAKAFFQDTPLHIAASNGHIDIVKILIDARADVNAKDLDQDTPLHKAASNGHNDTVKILIDANADVNAMGKFEDTPLHRAALNGKIDIVKILIDANVEVNARNRNYLKDCDGTWKDASTHGLLQELLCFVRINQQMARPQAKYNDTPLYKAAFNRHSDIVNILIDAKADANAKSWVGDTPLHRAALNGDLDTVKMLIDANAEINAKNKNEVTPLQNAAINSHTDIVKILIDAKAEVNAKDSVGDTLLHRAALNGDLDTVKMLIDANAEINAKNKDTPLEKAAINRHTDIEKILIDAEADSNEETPLQKAAFNGHTNIAKILIDAKADANAKDSIQDIPLHMAAFNGHSDIVRILIEVNADVNAIDRNQATPLHAATYNGHSDIVRMLIDAKADVNAKLVDQVTPLHMATYYGHSDVERMLVDAKADVNAKAENQVTPLLPAVLKGNSDVVRMLIDAKSDVNAKDKNQVTPLHHAVLKGNSDVVRMLIDAKSDVNAKDKNQITPLHTATYIGHSDIVRMLIDAKADVNAKVGNQVTPLHAATYNGDSDVVRMLVDAKADVNAKAGNQVTPLHAATYNGHSDVVRMLVDAKADVNAKAGNQVTPLHHAVLKGNSDVVRMLIDAKSDVNAKDENQITPLHAATYIGHSDVVRMLIDAKADVNAKLVNQVTPLHAATYNGHSDVVRMLVDAKADVNAKAENQVTPLHMATYNGHSDLVMMLVDAKADVNAKAENQDTPLHFAALNGHVDIVKILIDVKADANARDWKQDTPLHWATVKGHSDTVRMLIDAKSDVNAKGMNQFTPLQIAALNGYSDTVEILIDAKADVNAIGWMRNTPLHSAAFNGHSDIVRILIDAKSDVNAKGWNQFTPLQIAALNGYSDTVEILIDAKADVNAIGWMRNTPLHSAAFKGHSDIVRILIDAKSDVNAKGSNQFTPLQIAALNGYSDTVEILIDAKADVNAIGWMRNTPLHSATFKGHSDIVRILIDAKSDVNAKGSYKNTPLHEAARCGRFGIIRILLTSAADFSIRNIDGKTAEELGNPKSKKVFKDCFEKIPREIKRLGVDAIRHFLRSLNDDAVPVNVVSFMLFGHDGVGKTTLLNSFLGLPRKKTKVTNGIDLHMGKIFANINTDEQTDKIIGQNHFTQINVWNFAGKMMYYTMHLEHLSPRGLYFLVFNASLGLDGMVDDPSVDPSDKGKIFVLDYIDFWVTTITTYVQSNVRGFPRIALVGTHIDKISDTLKISKIIEEIKIKFQPLVDTGQLIILEDLFINALYMNAETTRKLSEIILSCGKSYPEYGQMIPRSWNDLHQKLILRKSEIVIAFDQLDQMNSHMEKPLNEKELTLCIQYFHNLGYFLFFPDEEMKDHVVLDPRWVTNAMLHFITCSNQTSNSGEQKWLQMHTTGKIEKAQLDEVLLEKNADASYGHYLHRVVKKLDLVSEPKVYNSEGFEECQNYFYMPCIVNRDISSDALSLIENQEAVQVSFSFSTVIPPAVYNRLVASSLSLWPVFNGHIYNGLIILRSGPLHLISFRREYTKINISVVHLQDRRHINVCLCRTIVQFVEQRLTWILSTYNTSTVERKSLFNITYNSAAAEILKDRKIEKGEHEQCEGCQESRKRDVTQENYEPDDLFLMRVASRLTDNDIYPLAAKVYNHERFADDLQSEYTELGKSDIAWLILMEWKRQAENKERTPKVTGLRLVLHQARINPHIFCKVMNQKDEYPFFLDPDYLETDVHSELLHAVADRISSEYIHVGLELGLKADDILKLLKNFKGRTVGLIRAMLQEWYDKNKKKGHVKVVKLVTALLNAKSDISVFYEFEKERFHARH